MEARTRLLATDKDRWNEFRSLLDRVPVEAMDRPTLNDDGWSVKDLLWHMRCWNMVVAAQLEAIQAGTFDGAFDWNTDENNVRFLAEGHTVDAASARTELLASRERSRAAFEALDTITPKAEELFSETAFKHTDDHLPELHRFVEEVS